MTWSSIIKTALVLVSLLNGQAIAQQMTWNDPMEQEIPILQGRAWNSEILKSYQRLPPRAEKEVRKAVWSLSQQTAGLYVQFMTNAACITVRYGVTGERSMPHMPATGVSGVDLYATDAEGQQYWCAGQYVFGDTIQYTYNDLAYHNPHDCGNLYTLYLPLRNGVRFLHIGVAEDSQFCFIPSSMEKPVVVYGTSIAQGVAASRPGMAWTNQLQRRLNCPIVNLGFAGNGVLEHEMFELLSEIDAAVYVIDCMPNMTDERTKFIRHRIENGLVLLRRKSRAPIILVEHDGYMGKYTSSAAEERFRRPNSELRAVYEEMKNKVESLYYLTYEELGLSMDSQVDGVHVTDLGMSQYANAYCHLLRPLLYPGIDSLQFTPSIQHRNAAAYSWIMRHSEVLKYNKTRQPDVVFIGNSITHYWGGEPYEKRRVADDIWRDLFKDTTVANMGFGWDRIENISWRLLHGELDGFHAHQVWILAGINNLSRNTNDEIVTGILDLVKLVHARQPLAHIVVVKILPCRNHEKRIRQLNACLETALKNKDVLVVDVGNVLLQSDGLINEQLFSDGLHPNHQGYSRIADALRPYLTRHSDGHIRATGNTQIVTK